MKQLVVLCALVAVSFAVDKNLIEIAGELKLTKFVQALQDAQLKGDFEGEAAFTIFAPTDDALDKAAQAGVTVDAEILKYHVVNGKVKSADLANDGQQDTLATGKKLRTNIYEVGKDKSKVVTVNGVTVTKADQEAKNGYIHVVDKVITAPTGNAVDAVAGDATLSRLQTALTNGKLLDTLKGDGPFTIFAPTDTAFNDITNIDTIIANETEIARILKNHVVSGIYYSAGLYDDLSLKNLAELAINVDIEGGKVKLNDQGTVTTADISLTNGVVHKIDKVLTNEVQPDTGAASHNAGSLITLFVAVLVMTYLKF